MNKNKGFIGIGLIVAIVLGIVVVGGGAYYFGKNSPKQEVNNLPIIDKNLPVKVASECTPNSPSTIKLISPNGGEVYQVGQKITVKWKSCNVTPNSISFSLLKHDISKPYQQSEMYRTSVFSGSDPYVLEADDGTSEFMLPNFSNVKLTPGQQYFIGISGGGDATNIGSGYVPGDYSDGLFTINSGTNQISTCNPNSAPSIKVISPNGGETYTVGQQITIKWESCNVKSGLDGLILKHFPADINFKNIDISNVKNEDKMLTWTIPSDIDTTKKYIISLETGLWKQNDNEYKLFDDSDKPFTIKK